MYDIGEICFDKENREVYGLTSYEHRKIKKISNR